MAEQRDSEKRLPRNGVTRKEREMKKRQGNSNFGYVWHFDDDERGDISFSLAHQGESCASVARRYEVSPSVIRRVFRQIMTGDSPQNSTANGDSCGAMQTEDLSERGQMSCSRTLITRLLIEAKE